MKTKTLKLITAICILLIAGAANLKADTDGAVTTTQTVFRSYSREGTSRVLYVGVKIIKTYPNGYQKVIFRTYRYSY